MTKKIIDIDLLIKFLSENTYRRYFYDDTFSWYIDMNYAEIVAKINELATPVSENLRITNKGTECVSIDKYK